MKQNIDERLQKAAEEYIELPDSCLEYSDDGWEDKTDCNYVEKAFKAGAQWKDKQLMAKAIDVEVKVDAGGYPYVDRVVELYDYEKDIPLAKKGDKYKLILIKED